MLHGQMSDGNIVAFRRPMTTTRSASLPCEAERGTVLVFTGVRYERPSEPSASSSDEAAAGAPHSSGDEGH